VASQEKLSSVELLFSGDMVGTGPGGVICNECNNQVVENKDSI
jgi:hypothetical protein